MSMFTECFITKVSFPAMNGKITIVIEPTQKYQVELEGVKYCLFVSGETEKDGREKKSGEENENSQKDDRTAVLRQIGKCQWNWSLSDMHARVLMQAKLSKARVKLVIDEKIEELECVELV